MGARRFCGICRQVRCRSPTPALWPADRTPTRCRGRVRRGRRQARRSHAPVRAPMICLNGESSRTETTVLVMTSATTMLSSIQAGPVRLASSRPAAASTTATYRARADGSDCTSDASSACEFVFTDVGVGSRADISFTSLLSTRGFSDRSRYGRDIRSSPTGDLGRAVRPEWTHRFRAVPPR